jgi:glycosyltransferase involved in cell wall biosynthesis
VEGFGRALEQVLTDEHTAARLGVAAREYAMRLYTWEAKARKTIAVYDWVLGHSSKPNFWSS